MDSSWVRFLVMWVAIVSGIQVTERLPLTKGWASIAAGLISASLIGCAELWKWWHRRRAG